MQKFNIQRFSEGLDFSGTPDFELFGTAAPPANFHSPVVGEDLSGKEIMIIFCKRFGAALGLSQNWSMTAPYWGYKIALDETTFVPSNNTLFFSPANFLSASGPVTYKTLLKSDTHQINAISQPNTKVLVNNWNEASGTTTYEAYDGVMDNRTTVMARRYTLPDDFGVLTEIASNNWASNIFIKDDDFQIDGKNVLECKIDNKKVLEMSNENKIVGYWDNKQPLEFGQNANGTWLTLDYSNNNKIEFLEMGIMNNSYIQFVDSTLMFREVVYYMNTTDNFTDPLMFRNVIELIGYGTHGARSETTVFYECDVKGQFPTSGGNITKVGEANEYYRMTDIWLDNPNGYVLGHGNSLFGVTPKLDRDRIIPAEYTLQNLSTEDNAATGLILNGNFPINIDKQIFPNPVDGEIATLFSVSIEYNDPYSEYNPQTYYIDVIAQMYRDYDGNTGQELDTYSFFIGSSTPTGGTIFAKKYGSNTAITNNAFMVTPTNDYVTAKLTNLNTSSPMYPYVKKVVWNE